MLSGDSRSRLLALASCLQRRRVAHCHEQAAEDPKTALIRLTVGIDMTHRRLELKGKDMAALEVCGVYVGA